MAGPSATDVLKLNDRDHGLCELIGAVVIGGGVYGEDARGFIQVLSVAKGERVVERTFPAPLTYSGLALAGSRVHATFADGSAACLGSKSP